MLIFLLNVANEWARVAPKPYVNERKESRDVALGTWAYQNNPYVENTSEYGSKLARIWGHLTGKYWPNPSQIFTQCSSDVGGSLGLIGLSGFDH